MANAPAVACDGARVMAASEEAMAVIDDDEFVAVNEAFATLFGIEEPATLVGEAWQPRFADEGRQFVEEVLPTTRDAGEWDGRATGVHAEGHPLELSVTAVGLDDDQVLCITDESRPERLEGAATPFFEQVLDAVEAIVYVLDEAGDPVYWNATLRDRTGYSDAELQSIAPGELFATEGDDPVTALGEDPTEVTVVTADGRHIPHSLAWHPIAAPDARYRAAVARDITDRERREQNLAAARQSTAELVEHAPFGMFRLDEELRITYENPRAEEIIGLPDDEESSAAIGTDIRELPPIIETGQADLFTQLQHGETIEFEFPFESIYGKEAYFTGRAVPLYRDGEFDGALLMANDISERRQHERDLERQRDELATLDRINELLFEITRDAFESPSRTEIEQTVCDRLTASELYRFAWVGVPEMGGDRIVPAASAGVDDGYIETTTVTTTEADTGQGPAGRAYRSGEVQVSQDVRSDPRFEPWRDAALDRGIQSAAAVPLVYGDTIYGVLAVYATRPLAFSDREQAGFETLGEAIGFAINAVENRRLLFADTVVELEVETTDSDLVFVDVSAALGCDLSITGVVEADHGEWSVYLQVAGAAPGAVADRAATDAEVEAVRTVAAEDDTGVLEVVMTGSGLAELFDHGAVLTAGTVSDGVGRFCIEAPQSKDLRWVVDRFQAAYESSVVAHRELDRPVQRAVDLRQSLADRLTDRQREALHRAYHAGYFEWPRQSTGGEVAASMDLAETTYHYHLRNALDTLLTALISLDER